jgi:glycosyltransferase involved in cell wall biosynthesis
MVHSADKKIKNEPIIKQVSEGWDYMVSVICLTYNHEKYLADAINSILDQVTTFEFEILIGEDRSPDNSRVLLQEYEKQYPNRFKIFYREKNLGGNRNFYEIMKYAKGKYVAYLELDDLWLDKYKLQKQVDFLNAHKEYIGVACDFQQIDCIGNIIKNRCVETKYLNTQINLKDFLKAGFIFQTATLMHRNYFHDGNDYTIFYKSHNLVGDITNLSFLLLKGNIFIMKDIMSAYRYYVIQSGTNASSISQNKEQKSLLSSAYQLNQLSKYFKRQIDYSGNMERITFRYFINFLKRKDEFDLKGLLKMLKYSSLKAKVRFLLHMFTFPIERIGYKIRK